MKHDIAILLLLSALYVAQSYYVRGISSMGMQLRRLPCLSTLAVSTTTSCNAIRTSRQPFVAYCMHNHNSEHKVTKSTGLSPMIDGQFPNDIAIGNQPTTSSQDLLAKYGIAYLLTSISFSIASYSLCYTLVANGVDVAALLERFGMRSTKIASSAGTVAIAYACHKAASPLRFPPTVAMTPVVARWIDRLPLFGRSRTSQFRKEQDR